MPSPGASSRGAAPTGSQPSGDLEKRGPGRRPLVPSCSEFCRGEEEGTEEGARTVLDTGEGPLLTRVFFPHL